MIEEETKIEPVDKITIYLSNLIVTRVRCMKPVALLYSIVIMNEPNRSESITFPLNTNSSQSPACDECRTTIMNIIDY